jgi:pimeloyl-ACP methyl ester carboxylesterase
MARISATFVVVLFFVPGAARASSTCDPDGIQGSGSIYRICMPAPEDYNGMLVVWAHGFQDAGTPVEIPEDQLCLAGLCLSDVVNSLGFGFATNSYSKTGLAVLQGKNDLVDLVRIFAEQKGPPLKVYLVGASQGGLITALSLEQHPDVYAAGVAACGPIGDFPSQINYFGDARATFDIFFPGVIPGPTFHPDPGLVSMWNEYYDEVVKPIVFHPDNRFRLDQWVAVAQLPFDAGDYLATVEVSVRDVLRYAVVNLHDATAILGGFPFDNQTRFYFGSANDFLLNLAVPRVGASPAAIAEMNASYQTTGQLQRPLVTLHTLRDQQVPYFHEPIYTLKTLLSGSFLARHLPIAVDRFEHCNFTADEALASFAIMLFYDGVIDAITGVASTLTGDRLAGFERLATEAGLPYRRSGATLALKLRRPR